MKRIGLIPALAMAVLQAFAQTDSPPALEQTPASQNSRTPNVPPSRGRGKLQVEFEGASAFKGWQLREGIARQIQSIEEFGLDEANVYDAVFFLESFYRRHGYSQAEVTSSVPGPWRLRLIVNEGPLTRVGAITFMGNHAYNTVTLTNYLLGPTRERYPRIRQDTRLPFIEADVFFGAELIRRLYAAEGYLNAVINPPEITLNADNTSAAISLTIEEGIQFHFGEIQFEGPLVFARETLLAEIAEDTKTFYTAGRLASAQRRLEDFYKKRGYFTISVEARGDPAAARDGKVRVVFQVEPGPIYRFDGVTVRGNQRVKPTFIEKRLRRLQGRVYDPGLLDRQFRELIETGLFRDLRITPAAVESDLVRLDVNVEESKSKELGLGLGYGSFYGLIIDVNYTDRNLFGTGRRLSITPEWNQRGLSGEVIYADPWLFDTDYRLKLRLYALTSTLKGYSKDEVGFSPSLSRQITDHWEVSAFALVKYVAVTEILINPSSLVGPGNYSVVGIGVSQTLDYRNNKVLPTKGFIFDASLDLAPNGLGAISFVRGRVRFSYYVPVTAKSSLALGARAGLISSLSSEELPIDERFFNGGATTVRSFSELTLGPRDNAGYPLGGESFTVFNIEYIFPIWGDVYGALFLDAGNVVQNAASFGVEDMRYAMGAGLRYNLPIGAVRFDYGLNPSPKPGEAQGAFHFAIGVAF
ncbi:MAG TPA: outer membrane protein assembly factor BamA [Terrimicrobiaceae bacterium]